VDQCPKCEKVLTLADIEDSIYVHSRHVRNEVIRAETECPSCHEKFDIDLKIMRFELR
jgi:transcriptional regulator NrdR family protein